MSLASPTFLSRRPSLPLARFVSRLWASDRVGFVAGREINLPTGRIDLVIPLLDGQVLSRFADARDVTGAHYRGAIVEGAHDTARQRATPAQSSVVGVQFRPGGASAFFGRALSALENQTVPLDALWGSDALVLRERLQAQTTPAARLTLLETILTARLSTSDGPDPQVAAALAVLQRSPAAARIGPARDASGLGATWFLRRFRDEVGLTPKRYARVLRLGALLRLIPAQGPRDLADLAAQAGYADQAHLAHDFRCLTGITASEYRAAAPDRPTHVAVTDDFDKTHRRRSGKVEA